MNVPNHEKKAFRDMMPEERSAIVEAWIAGKLEVLKGFDWLSWYEESSSYLRSDGIYRTRPRQLVIPWEHIKPEYKWAAMDEDGRVNAHSEKPNECSDGWWSKSEGGLSALNINTTGIDWRESLTARPEGA